VNQEQSAGANCLSTLQVPTSKSALIDFYGVSGVVKMKNTFSDLVDIPGTTGDGVIQILPIRPAADWTLQVDSGCISLS
jgi:hypothetical protein